MLPFPPFLQHCGMCGVCFASYTTILMNNVLSYKLSCTVTFNVMMMKNQETNYFPDITYHLCQQLHSFSLLVHIFSLSFIFLTLSL